MVPVFLVPLSVLLHSAFVEEIAPDGDRAADSAPATRSGVNWKILWRYENQM
jgi:hypothetical protein